MAKKRTKKMYNVYCIIYEGQIIYVGMTDNIKRRTSQHNRMLRMQPESKELYKFLHEKGTTEIILIPINTFESRTDAKRLEAYLILDDYFGDRLLKQKVPNISDR
jgi:predicted GIY-YIG superfamily endonuclease